MSMFLLYLLVKLDALRDFIAVFLILSIIAFILITIICGVIISDSSCDEEYKSKPYIFSINFYKSIKKLIAMFFVVLFIRYIIPSTNEFAFIYIASKLSTSDKAVSMADKAIECSR